MKKTVGMALWIAGCTPGEATFTGGSDPLLPVESVDSGTDTGFGIESVGSLDGDISDWWFSSEEVHEFHIELGEQGFEALRQRPSSWTEAVFSDGSGTPLTAGIRLKGSSTWRAITGKASFKIDFEFEGGPQRYRGVEGLNLHSMIYDPSLMAENLAYEVFRSSGVPASRVGYAWLTIDGELFGLYSVVEELDDSFLERWFEDPNGNLYELAGSDMNSLQWADIDEQGEPTDGSDITALSDAYSGADRFEVLPDILDMDEFLMQIGTEMLVAHWDGYAGNLNNYFLYYEPSRGLFTMSPWSTDLAWGWHPWGAPSCGSYMINPRDYRSGGLANRCWGNELCKSQLIDVLGSQADHLESLALQDRLWPLFELLEPYAESDPRISSRAMLEQVECLESFISGRPEQIRGMISGP